MSDLFGIDPWEAFLSRAFDGSDFDVLIRKLAYHAEKKSWIGSLASALEAPDSMGEMGALERTRRIDGLLPLHVPGAMAISALTAQFLEEIAAMGHAVPDPLNPGELGRELGICLLAVFHGRRLPIDFGMGMDLRLEAREGDGSLTTPGGLSITGVLPLGGKITVLYSGLDPVDCLDFPAADLIRASQLTARRKEGRLRLVNAQVQSFTMRISPSDPH